MNQSVHSSPYFTFFNCLRTEIFLYPSSFITVLPLLECIKKEEQTDTSQYRSRGVQPWSANRTSTEMDLSVDKVRP